MTNLSGHVSKSLLSLRERQMFSFRNVFEQLDERFQNFVFLTSGQFSHEYKVFVR